jgi:hypothetical protein
MRRIVPHLGNPICTTIFHTPAKDSRASPGPVRHDRSARSCHDPATVRWQARLPRRGSGARTPRATGAPHYMTSHPASDLPASKAHDRDRLVRYPGATGHRPPADPRRHRAQASPNDHADASDSADERGPSPRWAWLSRHWAISGCGVPVGHEDPGFGPRPIPGSLPPRPQLRSMRIPAWSDRGQGKSCSGVAGLHRSDVRVGHELPYLLCTATGDGDLGSPLQRLLA